jgi:hypothetical protein
MNGKTVMPWVMLRARMGIMDIDQKHLARKLNRGVTYVNVRLNGHACWEIEECLKMMSFLGIKKEQFLDYFGTEPVLVEV